MAWWLRLRMPCRLEDQEMARVREELQNAQPAAKERAGLSFWNALPKWGGFSFNQLLSLLLALPIKWVSSFGFPLG